MEEEVRMAQLVPLEREKETKWLTYRNELLANGEKKILENEVDLILFIDSWTEKNSKDHFAASEGEEVIYVYKLKVPLESQAQIGKSWAELK